MRRRSAANPRAARNSAVAFSKFVAWNLLGEGKRLLSNSSSSFWYRDEVFYCNWRAIGRFVRGPSGGYVFFADKDKWFYGMFDYNTRENTVRVDDVCVSGVGEGLTMPVPKFLDCVRRQFLARSGWCLDRIVRSTAPGVKDRCDFWKRQIVETGVDYDRTRTLLNLNWKPYPLDDLLAAQEALIEKKNAAYNDPANVRRREREKARRQAALALGVTS